jgi:hypothetical protein
MDDSSGYDRANFGGLNCPSGSHIVSIKAFRDKANLGGCDEGGIVSMTATCSDSASTVLRVCDSTHGVLKEFDEKCSEKVINTVTSIDARKGKSGFVAVDFSKNFQFGPGWGCGTSAPVLPLTQGKEYYITGIRGTCGDPNNGYHYFVMRALGFVVVEKT